MCGLCRGWIEVEPIQPSGYSASSCRLLVVPPRFVLGGNEPAWASDSAIIIGTGGLDPPGPFIGPGSTGFASGDGGE